MKKSLRITLIISAVIMVLAGIVFFGFKKNIHLDRMRVYDSEHFNIYYESLSQKTLTDIEATLEAKAPVIRDFFGLEQDQKGKVVVYDNIDRFQQAYLGFILSRLYGDWASGASYEDMVLITSPENPGSGNSYAGMLEVVVHEYVHTLVFRLNEIPDIWLDEGLATYLAGQKSVLPPGIPTFAAMQKQDMDSFVENEGYAYSSVYVEYLLETYGKEKLLGLVKSGSYADSLGKAALDVYNEWVRYLEQRP